MKNRNFLIVGIIIVFVIIGVLVLKSKGTQSLPIIGKSANTAQSAYTMATSEAKKFSGDSVLVDLNTSGVQPDGTSKTWYVFFYSPSKKTNLKVNVVEGNVDKTEEKNVNKTEPITGNWIDSTAVAKVTLPKCEEVGNVTEPDYFIRLNSGKNGGSPIWGMNCLVGENKTLTVDVDAITGAFIRTGKAGIGW